ncbi:hypothetical protein BGX34_001546 [Mortierella sp. NVP85]|nr:hypothetical protein BGX34_001546 [Mortierella sp. NVP85]
MTPTPRLFGPHLAIVSRHRHLIHDLTLIKGVAPFVRHQYPNVCKLTIDFREVYQSQRESVSLELKETFSSLVQLTLRMVVMRQSSWIALEMHSQVRILQLEDTLIGVDNAEIFWKVFANLEAFEMTYNSIPGIRKKLQEDVKFYRMRKLVLNILGADDDQIKLFIRCPRLEELGWTKSRLQRIRIDQAIQNLCWPHLERLSIDYPFQDDELASLLQGAGNSKKKVVQVNLSKCYLEARASAALASHFNTLVEVNLTDCVSVLRSTTQDLLCLCPRLEVLETSSVMAKDIVAGDPWVCRQLRKLTIGFWFVASDKCLQHEIFGRLSTFIHLEELTMRIPQNDVGNGTVLTFQLDCGMGQLASLRELTTFRVVSIRAEYSAGLGKDEFEWIKKHWKNLKVVKGNLVSNRTENYLMKKAFRRHGITVDV